MSANHLFIASERRITLCYPLRRMFGKTGVFCDGVMLGMVTDNTLYFRVDDENRVTFKEAESYPPLNYQEGQHHRPLLLARAGAPVRRAR